MPSAAPFFIVGFPRSGTTLLRFILSSHSRLCVPDETGFLPFLKVSPDRTLSQADVVAVVRRIERLNTGWRGLATDVDHLHRELLDPRLSGLLDLLYRRKTGQRPDQRWGDKTPGYLVYIPRLHQIFPDAQFIHIVRDGRDAALSALAKWPDRRHYMDTYYLLKNWTSGVTAARACKEGLGGKRYLEVQYEALVEDAAAVARAICEFLGEPFEPGMLEHTRLASSTGVRGQDGVLKPVYSSSAGRWRTEMTAFDRKLAVLVAGDALREFGYPVAPVPSLETSEKIRLAWLGARYWAVGIVRRALYQSGILTLNRGMRRKSSKA